MNPRIQIMVQSQQLEPNEAEDREVLARWRKAVRTYADSRKDLGPDSVLTLSYQAGLQAATAIVRAAGYRVRHSASGHHRIAFEALRALGIADLSPLAREMNDLRRERHHAVYEWDDDDEGAEGMDPARLDEIVSRLLRLGHQWLRNQRPSIAADLDPPPDA